MPEQRGGGRHPRPPHRFPAGQEHEHDAHEEGEDEMEETAEVGDVLGPLEASFETKNPPGSRDGLRTWWASVASVPQSFVEL